MSDHEDFDFLDFGDDDVSDDDILENFEDSSGGSPSEELSSGEITRRINAYQAKTIENSQIVVKPKQFDKARRLEAVRWLGESGNPKAIPSLIKVYQKDKTPGMKEAAAYALGQFKAFKRDEDDPEMQNVALQRIDDIILYSKLGKRSSPALFIILEVVLVVLAIALFSVGGIFSIQNENIRQTAYIQATTDAPTWTPDTEDALKTDLENYYADLVSDANFYQQQMAAVTRGEGLNCSADARNKPRAYTVSEMWLDTGNYTNVTTELNDILSQMAEITSSFDRSCSSGVVMTRDEALRLGTIIIEVQRGLAAARDGLNSAGIEVTEQVFATSTPGPTDTPNPGEPTATEDLAALTDVIIELERIINDMTFRGATTDALFNWQQVVDNGEIYRSGCNQPEPIIPDDYVLPASLQGMSAQLDNAVSNVNIGLQSTRLSVSAFYAACSAGEVPEDAIGRLAQAQLAESAFTSATTDLNALQGR